MDEDRGIPLAPYRDAERGGTALLVIDMIGRMEFTGAEAMRPAMRRAADAIGRLRDEAEAERMPVIYINDNFGEWHSEASRLIDRAVQEDSPGRDVAERVRPGDRDYFIIKPQFSGFYATNLPVLLPKLGVSRLVLTGLSADVCVLFTAADAHMRDYRMWVPADAVAAPTPEREEVALAIMRQSMKADTRSTRELSLRRWHDALDTEDRDREREADEKAAEPA